MSAARITVDPGAAYDAYLHAAKSKGLTPFPKDGKDREWRIYISRAAWDAFCRAWGWDADVALTPNTLLMGYPCSIGDDLTGTDIRIVQRTHLAYCP